MYIYLGVHMILCLLLLAIFYCECLAREIREPHVWCDPYQTFCLFTFGSVVKVSSLEEAERICTSAKKNSRLLEITEVDELHTARAFKNYAFLEKENVLISNESLSRPELEEYGFYHFQSTEEKHNYAVVCMTDCVASWTVYENSKLIDGKDYPKEKFPIHCAHTCETDESKNCVGVERDSSLETQCWYYDANSFPNLTNFDGEALYIIDRTRKNPERCVGNIKKPKTFFVNGYPKLSVSENGTSKKWIAITIVLILIALISTSAFAYSRREKNYFPKILRRADDQCFIIDSEEKDNEL